MAASCSKSFRGELVNRLRRQICALEETPPNLAGTICPSGCEAVDRLLPYGGFRRGSLVEWLAEGRGTGAAALALIAAREACRDGGMLIVFDRERNCYPPAIAAWGIELQRVVIVRPANKADELWAVDLALRSTAVAAVWGWFGRLDGRTFRRWQLAAEASGGLGLLLRPAAVRGQPTWADVQLCVEPRAAVDGRGLFVEVLRARGGAGGGKVELKIDETGIVVTGDIVTGGTLTGIVREMGAGHETLAMHHPAELADPTPARRPTGT